MNRIGTYGILLGMFLLSVAVRLPNLNRPLSKHHEYCTALSLVMLESWQKGGIAKYNYAPVQLYPEESTQVFYKNANHPLADDSGNLYYLSHPPLAFYLPYFIFQTFGIAPSPIGLQVINLVFHGISAVFIYWIVVLLFGFREKRPFAPGLAASGVYLFAPAALWFQGNVFFADLFSLNFFVVGLYFTVKIFLAGKTSLVRNLVFFSLSLGLFCYADWLGFFFAFVVFVYALLKAFSDTFYFSIAGICVFIVFSIGTLIGWQYSLVSGLDAFLETSFFRFQERGFGDAGSHSFWEYIIRLLKKWLKIGIHYGTGFLPVLLLATGLYLRKYSFRNKKNTSSLPSIKLIVILGLFPVLLHHIVFLKYSVFHDFSVLKAAPFLAIITGWLSANFLVESKRSIASTAFGLTILFCVVQYYYINRPGDTSWKGHRYDVMKNIGLTIKEHTVPDEVVFLNGIKGPQISFYSKRNIFFAADTTHAKAIMKGIQAQKGRLFHVENRKVEKMEPIVVD